MSANVAQHVLGWIIIKLDMLNDDMQNVYRYAVFYVN